MTQVEYIVFPEVNANVFRHLQAAEGYLDLELSELAKHELQVVNEAGSMEGVRLLLWGKVYAAQGQTDEAIESLLQALSHHPFQYSADLWRTLGECYETDGQVEAAKQARKQADTVSNMKSIVAIFTCSRLSDDDDDSKRFAR